MTKPLCYLAGPMTGLPDDNFPAFYRYAKAIEQTGDRLVVNPADNGQGGESYEWYLRRGIMNLVGCDQIALMPYWRTSKGARLEAIVAQELGIPMFGVFFNVASGTVTWTPFKDQPVILVAQGGSPEGIRERYYAELLLAA